MQGVSLQVCGESPPTKSKWSAVEPTAVGRHGRISRLDTEPRQRLGPLCVGQGTRTAVHTPTRAPSTTDRRIFDSEEAASSRHRTKDFTPSRASARDGRTTFDAALGMFRLRMGESESSPHSQHGVGDHERPVRVARVPAEAEMRACGPKIYIPHMTPPFPTEP